jgi:hypothetical protein
VGAHKDQIVAAETFPPPLHRLTPRIVAGGSGVPVTVRIPEQVLQTVDRVLAEGVSEIRSRSEAINDALGAWLLLIENQRAPHVDA